METTSRLGLEYPDASDNVSGFPAVSEQQMARLDAAVIVTEGTLASRPSSGLVYGQTYYATDTGQWYFYNGAAWETALAASAWSALALPSGYVAKNAGDYTPSARLEGDIVRFKGTIQNVSGSNIGVNSTIFTLPSAAMYPTATVYINATASAGGSTAGVLLEVQTSGAAVLSPASGNWAVNGNIGLNSVTFTID